MLFCYLVNSKRFQY